MHKRTNTDCLIRRDFTEECSEEKVRENIPRNMNAIFEFNALTDPRILGLNALTEPRNLGLISVTIRISFLLVVLFFLTTLNSFFNRLSFVQLSPASLLIISL